MKKFKKLSVALIITVIVFLVTLALYAAGFFSFLEYKTYDLRVTTMYAQNRPHDDIIVLLLNQDSIDWAYRERGWPWPWPRTAYAEIIDYMNLGGAHSIAFDVIFSETSIHQMDDDASFAQASIDFGRVVQTVMFSSQTGRVSTWPAGPEKPLFELHGFENIIYEFEKLNRNTAAGQIRALLPIEELKNAAAAIGDVTGWPDSDQIFRRANLFTIFDGKAVPGLSAASLLVSGYDNKITYNEKKRVIEWGNWTIPIDQNGRSILHFRGSIDRYIPYFVHEILMSKEAYETGTTEEMGMAYLPPQDFYGKYVFLGLYAPGLFDIAHTPISSLYPGVGVHITMLDNILSGDFVRESSWLFNIMLILVVVLLISFLTLFSGRIPVTVGCLIFILAVIIALGFGAYYANVWTPLVAPLAGTLLAFFAATLYNYATEGRQRRFIKSAFSQYLSPLVIEQLVANPGLLNLGGEKREISIFFSDIQGFASISEKFKDDPRKLTEMLNDYLSFMTDTILDSGGTIDKYIGDAIVAFWNAPLNLENHGARAIRVSLSCQQKLAERQDEYEQKFGVRLVTRIGLNTGFAVVGNMGSSKRFSYTMLGDAVNLAARLEGLNKHFGTYLMCSDETFCQAQKAENFFGRKLAQVAVVGKKEPVTVWEPMLWEEFKERELTIKKFDEARDLFYSGKFAQALPLFQAIETIDSPSGFYAEQCKYFVEHPAEWKGYWEAKKK